MTKLLAAALMAVFIVFFHAFAGPLEGRVYPVVGRVEVELARQIETEFVRVLVRGSQERHCSFVRLELYFGTPQVHRLVAVAFEERGPLHGSEQLLIGPLWVNLNPTHMDGLVFADIYHRCHGLWLTRSRAYG
jgi:hypothetical protein